MILIPVFMAVTVCDFFGNETVSRLSGAVIFGVTGFTDMLDGKIARKRGLVTDFGKFLDPVADKLMIIGAYLSIMYLIRCEKALFLTLLWTAFIVVVREIAVTSLRMIVSTKSEVVIAAAWPGKAKTVCQIVSVLVLLLEPVLFRPTFIAKYHILSYLSLAAVTFMTIYSGILYFKAYKDYLDPEK